MKLMQVYL